MLRQTENLAHRSGEVTPLRSYIAHIVLKTSLRGTLTLYVSSLDLELGARAAPVTEMSWKDGIGPYS